MAKRIAARTDDFDEVIDWCDFQIPSAHWGYDIDARVGLRLFVEVDRQDFAAATLMFTPCEDALANVFIEHDK